MQFNNFFRKMLPIAAAVAISSTSFSSFAQSYDVHNVTTGFPINTFATLQAAVDACVIGDSCVITLTGNDLDVTGGLDNPVTIGNGLKITLTSKAGEIDTILQPNMARHIELSGQLTLENIVLKGMGLDFFENFINTTGWMSSSDDDKYNGGIKLTGTLITNHGTLITNCNATAFGGCVSVYGGTFTMNDGIISNNNTKWSGGVSMGGGVYILAGEFIMEDGIISGNTSFAGGGVYIHNSDPVSQFTMNGGIISDNTAWLGGGVGIDHYGVFTMTNGIITGNMAFGSPTMELNEVLLIAENVETLEELAVKWGYGDIEGMLVSTGTRSVSKLIERLYLQYAVNLSNGGGVCVYGTFTMTGGSIINNTAQHTGGGIYTADIDYVNPADTNAYFNITIVAPANVAGNHSKEIQPNPDNYLEFTNRINMPFDGLLLNNDEINYYPTRNVTIDTICFTDSVTLAVTVVNGGQNPVYQWFRNGVAVDDSNDSIFKYKSNGRDTIQCKVYPDTACGDEVYSKIMVIEMLDSLALDQPSNNEVCSGETVPNIIFSGVYDYVRWEVTTGNGLTIGMPANSGTGDISSFTTTNSGIVTITATPVSGRCEGVSKTFTITVNPKTSPKATIRIK